MGIHDIGKIGIPDKVLQKPGKLDDEEWNVMRSHSFIGSQIIGSQENELLRIAGIVAYEHHEKWNGKGYPGGLNGEEINLFARIVAVADVFDALTSKRPYKDAWPDEKAINLIKEESGEHFDPNIVKAFEKTIDKILINGSQNDSNIIFPSGRLSRLNKFFDLTIDIDFGT